MRTAKILGFAGALVAAAVVGGTLINVVFAGHGSPITGTPTAASDSQPGVYCQTFLDEFAKQLGVDESALLPAAKTAADAAIDKALADGKITKATADALKQRVANADGNVCGLPGARFPGLQRVAIMGNIGSDLVSAAAGALNLSVADLKSKLASGESLKQIAADQKVDYATVTSAVHNAAKADLDKLVSDGKLTAERESAILDRLDQALANGHLAGGGLRHPGLRMLRPFGGLGPFAPSAPSPPAASPSGTSS